MPDDDDGYVELTGDDIPYHLRMDSPPLAQCNRCGRVSWTADEINTTDQMPQPDGQKCGGLMVSRVLPETFSVARETS